MVIIINTIDIDAQQYLGFITKMAKQFTDNKDFEQDLIQEGYIGIMEAKKNFNPNIGIKFLTYACPYIKNRILRYYNKNKKEQCCSFSEDLKLNYEDSFDDMTYLNVEDVLEDCSEDTKNIIDLILTQGMTIREVAEQLGYSKSKVSYILSKDKEKIYKKIKKNV